MINVEFIELSNEYSIEGVAPKPRGFVTFKVSHFRCYDKKSIMKNGGNTVLSFILDNAPAMVVSRCSANETYSRKKGIETCIHKYVKRIFNTDVISITKGPNAHGSKDSYVVEIHPRHPKVYTIR